MLRMLQGEDAREQRLRATREHQQRQGEIASRDAEAAPGMAQNVALAQMANQQRRLPLDYAAIIQYRAIDPGQFVHLPSDEECRRALRASGPNVCECHVVHGDHLKIEAGCPTHGALLAKKLKK